MTWCVTSGISNNCVVSNNIQMMADRFSIMYVPILDVINTSNIDFTYNTKTPMKIQIFHHNKRTPNLCDLRIIPFPFGGFVNEESVFKFVASYRTCFFSKHHPQAVINPYSYLEQVLDNMKRSEMNGKTVFIYAKDCHLYELFFAKDYINYAKIHLDDHHEFKSHRDRV